MTKDQSEISPFNIAFEQDPERKTDICNSILRSLPKWFGIEEAIVEYTKAVRSLIFVAASVNEEVVGFCAILI